MLRAVIIPSTTPAVLALALVVLMAILAAFLAASRRRALEELALKESQLEKSRSELASLKYHLENEVAQRARETETVKDATIIALASLAETRDTDTGAHIRRTQRYVRILAEAAGQDPAYAPELGGEVINLLFKTAPLHDIGKVGIPDRILFKPGPLTDEEFAIMKEHTTLGGRAISEAQKQLGESNGFLHLAHEIATTHHERWDGTGYPAGLRGVQIPLAGRLMAIADVYDALRSRRVYKGALSHEEACAIIRKDAGRHFDPALAGIFGEVHDAFRQVAEKFSDD
jgi:putative two-component system response regulator